jgi:pimeloyl-ACP methyl ester carboxylesterase
VAMEGSDDEMPELLIEGRSLRYSLDGQGVPVVLTPGGRLGMEALASTADLLGRSCRLLQWDRCNTGASQVWIDEPSEQLRWADDLVELLRYLDLGPAYLVGGSAGARVGYLCAIRHPEAVRGLVLWSVSAGPYSSQLLGYLYHTPYIEAAIRGGMSAVLDTPHYRALVAANPANRERLLGIDPERFIAVLRRWNESFFARQEWPVIGASAEDLLAVGCPTLVFEGNDDFHPPEGAQAIHQLVPGAELASCAWTRDEWMWRSVGRVPGSVVDLYPRMVPAIVDFVERTEAQLSERKC